MSHLFFFIKIFRRHNLWLCLGFILSFVCILAGVGLLAVSGWLVCSTALAGLVTSTAFLFNYFIPAAGIRFFALLRIVSRYGERVINHDTTFKILRDLRVWCYEKLEPSAPAFFYQYQSGELLQRFIGDIDSLDNLYLRILSPLLNAVLLAFFLLVFLCFFSVLIAQIVFYVFMLTIITACCFSYWLGKTPAKRIQFQQSVLRQFIISGIQGMMDLIGFSAMEVLQNKINQTNRDLIHAQKQISIYQGFSLGLMMVLSGLSIFLVLHIGIPLVHQHQLNSVFLALIVFVIMSAYEVITPLPLAFQYLGKTQQAAHRVHDIIDNQATVKWPTTFSSENRKNDLWDIQFENVDFSYPNNSAKIFENLNLQITAGQQIAITGASGSGKSTLAHLLVRSCEPVAGGIYIGNQNIKALSEQQLRQSVIYIEQHAHIFNHSIRENLLLANSDANDNDLWHALQMVQLDSVINDLPEQLHTEMGQFGLRFSGGQIKRIHLARAILSVSPIVILDEPSEGIDKNTFQRLWPLLIKNMQNRTLIVLTHQLNYFNEFDCVYDLGNLSIFPAQIKSFSDKPLIA